MRIRQPCVERKHGDLNGKSQEESEKHPELSLKRNRKVVELQKVESVNAADFPRRVIEGQNGNKHQQAAYDSVEDELDGRVELSRRITPNTDQQVHGNQHDFPEYVEKEQIQRHKHP